MSEEVIEIMGIVDEGSLEKINHLWEEISRDPLSQTLREGSQSFSAAYNNRENPGSSRPHAARLNEIRSNFSEKYENKFRQLRVEMAERFPDHVANTASKTGTLYDAVFKADSILSGLLKWDVLLTQDQSHISGHRMTYKKTGTAFVM